MTYDEAKRKVLARRARFMAAAGIAGAALSATSPARADDASVDDASIDDASIVDGGKDGSIFVEAGVRSDGAPPEPCLTMRKPEPEPCLSSCMATPNASSGPIAPAIIAAGAAVAGLRRRKKKT